MYDVYYWPTPNGYKITLFMEEAGLPYQLIPVDILKGDQFAPDFLRISPNNKMPALVDHAPADGGQPLSVFESGAILLYLAEKTGCFLPQDLRGRQLVLQWLFWQVAGLGPMAGQNHHFRLYAPERIAYATERYVRETARLYAVLDRQLSGRDWVAGDYSIADMAIYPWVVPWEQQGQRLSDFPQLQRWFTAMQERPAVQRAYAIQLVPPRTQEFTEAERQVLFGQGAEVVNRAGGNPA